MWIQFSDGTDGVLDMTDDVMNRKDHPLRDPSVFAQASIGMDDRVHPEVKDGYEPGWEDWIAFSGARDDDDPVVESLIRRNGTRLPAILLWWDLWDKWPYNYEFHPESLYVRVVYNDGQPIPKVWFQEAAA